MRLVACPNCHTQYDVSDVDGPTIACRCGETLANEPPVAVDAEIHRCGACGALVTGTAASCTYCGSDIVRDPRQLSLICPECFARNAEDGRFCAACGVAFRPELVGAEGHELPCPVCGGLMPPRQVGGVSANECPKCNGLWVEGENLERIVSRATEARRNADPEVLATLTPRVTGSNPAAQQVRYRKCPECDGYMQRRNFRKSSGVILDVCGAHGTWLDADELEQIAGFILSGGETSPLLEDSATPSQKLPPEAAAAFARMRVRSAQERYDFEETVGRGARLLHLLFDLLR